MTSSRQQPVLCRIGDYAEPRRGDGRGRWSAWVWTTERFGIITGPWRKLLPSIVRREKSGHVKGLACQDGWAARGVRISICRREELGELGYSKSAAKKQMQLTGQLSRWLETEGSSVLELTANL